jgi:superfamily I DNA/RNA helicase
MAILENIVSQYSMTRQLKSRINVSILYTYVMGNKNMDVSDTYRRTLKSLEALYITYKEDNMLYDCNDYPKYLYDVMQMYNESIYSIDALFVDEFQDVDKYQL